MFFSLSFIVSCDKAVKKFNKEILKADSLFKSGDYNNAKVHYYKADLLNPENSYTKRKLKEIDSIFVFNLKEVKFDEAVKVADEYFAIQECKKAKEAYIHALSLHADHAYVNNQIEEIDLLLEATQPSGNTNSYHIIVGCFMQKNNASRLQDKLFSANFDSKLIPRQNATLNAVTYTSHATIHEAYNNLKKAKNLQHKDSWVLYYNFAMN